jgi:hypothetical protein
MKRKFMLRIDEFFPYIITKTDELNYTVSEFTEISRGDNVGNTREVVLSYHGSLECALEDILRHKLSTLQITTVEDYIKTLKSMFKEFEEIVRGIISKGSLKSS